jgi:cation-transporting ATPase 13A2
LTEDGLDILGVRALDRRNGTRFGELLDNVYDLPGPMGREKDTFLYALTTCHQLKVVDGEVIGDPLDVKMFQFTKWTIEEGHVAGTGMIREARSGNGEARPAALVQTVVRPPGSAQFKLEDALKGGAKVGLLSLSMPFCCRIQRLMASLTRFTARAFLGVWSHSDV